MRNSGGNTSELYDGDGKQATRDTDTDGRKEMAESLERQHPDITKVVRKFGRWQHSVNYKGFKNNPLVKVNPRAREIVQEYGLKQRSEITVSLSSLAAEPSRLLPSASRQCREAA
jgi:hypothetical protein